MELFGDKEGDEGGDDRAQDSEKGIVVDADVARHQPCEEHAPQKARTCASNDACCDDDEVGRGQDDAAQYPLHADERDGQ